MNGGFSRPIAAWCIPLCLALASLAGCSVFNPPPAVAPPASSAPTASDSDAAASAAMAEPASGVIAEAVPDEPETELHPLQRLKRFIIKHRPKPVPPPVPAPVAPAPPAAIITIQVVPRDQARGLLDADVQRPNGKIIGRAVDMLVDAGGKPQEVVINLNGFMGVGDIKSNFPWGQFHFSPADLKAPVTLAFSPGETPLGGQPGGAGRKEAPPPTLPVLDTTVQNKNGVKVGRVVDVLLDKQAQPQAIVLDVSNSIGPDHHNIAATWSVVHLVTKDRNLQLQMDLTDAQIKAAPPYVSDQPARVIAPVAAIAAPAAPVAAANPAAVGASAATPHNPR